MPRTERAEIRFCCMYQRRSLSYANRGPLQAGNPPSRPSTWRMHPLGLFPDLIRGGNSGSSPSLPGTRRAAGRRSTLSASGGRSSGGSFSSARSWFSFGGSSAAEDAMEPLRGETRQRPAGRRPDPPPARPTPGPRGPARLRPCLPPPPPRSPLPCHSRLHRASSWSQTKTPAGYQRRLAGAALQRDTLGV